MSSDIKEVKELKEVLCRKMVSRIKKKYCKAERRLCKKLLKNTNAQQCDFLIKSSFIEYKKRFFGDLHKRIDDIVEGSIQCIESGMSDFICEKKRNRIFEVISLIKCILDRNGVIWAISNDYIKCRKSCKCPEEVTIIVCEENKNIALNIFNVLGERNDEGLYCINDVIIRLCFSFNINDDEYNLTKDKVDYCMIETESIPILNVELPPG